MKFCPECGVENDDTVVFCGECGGKQELKVETKIETPPIVISEKLYCRNCGKDVEKNAYACLGCGLPPMKAFNFCYNCGSDCHNEAVICIKCGINLIGKENLSKEDINKEKKFCRNCSNEVHKNAIVCLKCGLEPNKSKNFCPSCSAKTHNDAVLCIKCGCKLEEFAVKTQEVQTIKPQELQKTISQEVMPQKSVSNNVIVIGNQKSTGTAFILAFLFGPLGLLYASTAGGIIMFFGGLIIGVVTLGIGLLFIWPICIIWAVVAVQNSNKNSMQKGANFMNNNNN